MAGPAIVNSFNRIVAQAGSFPGHLNRLKEGNVNVTSSQIDAVVNSCLDHIIAKASSSPAITPAIHRLLEEIAKENSIVSERLEDIKKETDENIRNRDLLLFLKDSAVVQTIIKSYLDNRNKQRDDARKKRSTSFSEDLNAVTKAHSETFQSQATRSMYDSWGQLVAILFQIGDLINKEVIRTLGGSVAPDYVASHPEEKTGSSDPTKRGFFPPGVNPAK